MIQGIDIFAPRDSGLPDFTKISPAQIFNGSVSASLQAMKDRDPYGLESQSSYTGTPEAVNKQTTIDSTTGQRVEVRKARLVEETLTPSSTSPARRSPRRSANTPLPSQDYSAPGDFSAPDLPDNPGQMDSSLLDSGGTGPYSPLLPPPTPEEEKKTALGRLPVMLLDELKNLGYRV